MARKGPSSQHAAAVAEGAKHHEGSKTYSGSLMRPHVPYLSEMVIRLGIRSALDYGCGKGTQYQWRDPYHANRTIEERWGFEVQKYDPCWQPYATEPEGRFDLVICTHTLSLVPLLDLDWVIGRLLGLADRAVFIAEKIGARKKREVAVEGDRAIGWTVARWLDRLAPFADQYPGIEFVFSSREQVAEWGAIMTRWTRRDRGWHGEVAGQR